MSSIAVTSSTTTTSISVEELRRRQEAEREAQRQLISIATSHIKEQQKMYARIVNVLDDARARLPDLVFVAPALPGMPSANEAAIVQAYAEELTRFVARVEHDGRAAIAAAEQAQQYRQQLAKAWNDVHDIVAEITVRNQHCITLAGRLREHIDLTDPTCPAKSATLEEVQAALYDLQATVKNRRTQQASLEQRLRTRQATLELSGSRVQAVSAASQVQQWTEKKNAAAKKRAEEEIARALTTAGLTMETVPPAVQLQARLAIEQAQESSRTLQLSDLIHRHRVRRDGIERAKQLLANPPSYFDEMHSGMQDRWRRLVGVLESIECGLDEWHSSVELEYRQISEDCKHALQRAYARASFYEAAAAAGFQIDVTGDDLVLMDLDEFPGYRVEVREIENDDGYVTVAELMADPGVDSQNDAAVTKTVCEKLQSMTQCTDYRVKSDMEVVEKKPVIARAKRRDNVRYVARAKAINKLG